MLLYQIRFPLRGRGRRGGNSHTTQWYRLSSERQSVILKSSFQGKVFHTLRLHTLTANIPITSVHCCRPTVLHKNKFQLKSARSTSIPDSTSCKIHGVTGAKSCTYTAINCKTSEWQVIPAVASTTGWNLMINTTRTLVILTASYTHKPHDFSALIHQLTATQYFNCM